MHRLLLLTVLMLLVSGCETMWQQDPAPVAHRNAGTPPKSSSAGASRPDPPSAASRQKADAEGAWQDVSAASDTAGREASPPSPSKPSGEPLVTAAIFHFEEGNYARAEQLLRSGLAAGLPRAADRAQAHKYLAFISCVTERLAQCRTEFRQALKSDPAFALTAAEAGHPTWGPAFRAVQVSR
jgi:hypothetical protein